MLSDTLKDISNLLVTAAQEAVILEARVEELENKRQRDKEKIKDIISQVNNYLDFDY